MNKNKIRKEIAELIDNIKEHSEEIGNKKRIPQIELEAILSKIKKLYEKSIIYNYLNSQGAKGEATQNGESSYGETELIEVAEVDHVITDASLAKEASSDKKSSEKQDKKPTPIDIAKKQKIDDLGKAIGINQKILFTKELFDGNANEYSRAITALNSCQSFAEANALLYDLRTKHNWNEEKSSVLTFIDLIERKFA